jgi:hypothetical protein
MRLDATASASSSTTVAVEAVEHEHADADECAASMIFAHRGMHSPGNSFGIEFLS